VEWLQIYGDLMVFKMVATRHLGFWKFKFLTPGAVKRPILHNHAKFREDQSILCCDIVIFVIFKMSVFKMVAAAMLDFQKCEILTVIPML